MHLHPYQIFILIQILFNGYIFSLSRLKTFVFFSLKNATSVTAPINQQKLSVNQEDNTRNINQPIVKTADISTKDDNYHMIPIDRKEPNRQENEPILNKDSPDEQQPKIKEGNNNQETSPEEIINDKPAIETNAPNDE